MTTSAFLLMGDEKLPFSIEAIHLCGLGNGDRIASMDQYDQLLKAEDACSAAARAMDDALVKSFGASGVGG
ncbi:hypothetical protein ACPF8X_42200 [Streptomyces sp. G35A]